MLDNILVKDFMTHDVVSVEPWTPVRDVIKTLFLHDFNGVPVVDEDKKLLGLITEYDFISKGSPIYFSPIWQLVKELKAFQTDEKAIEGKIKEIISSEAKDIMNPQPITLSAENTVYETADLFMRHHRVNPIPVVSSDKKVIGIVSRHDLIKLYVDPSFWMKILSENP